MPVHVTPFSTLAVIGVGLIGGSIALAAKSCGIVTRVLGLGRKQTRLDAAVRAGVIDEGSTKWEQVATADLIVVCTPVDRIVQDVMTVTDLLGKDSSALITDVGSTKEKICESIAAHEKEGALYIGSHPLAGSEQSGWEHAAADLFINRTCVLTPDETIPEEAIARLERFWQALGMQTVRMSSADHDQALARTSHLPHVVASALVSVLLESDMRLVSTGFRDTTRIAGGDPSIWLPIFLENADAIVAAMDRLDARLGELRQALKRKDRSQIEGFLAQAKARREKFEF